MLVKLLVNVQVRYRIGMADQELKPQGVEVLPYDADTQPPERDQWERLPGETARAFGAFGAYRDLGPDRSLSKCAESLGRPSAYVRQLEGWSSANRWVERAAQWDDENDRLRRHALRSEALSVAQTRLRTADHALRIVGDTLDAYDREKRVLKPFEASRLMETASRAAEVPGLTDAPDVQGVETLERLVLERRTRTTD